MDPGEAVVLFGIVIASLLCISGLMVIPAPVVRFYNAVTNPLQIGTAWFFGARFDKIWSEASVFLPKATPLLGRHNEL